jgi:hypothetical protein
MTLDEQKFMAFEGLLGWTAAVLAQAKRVSAARDKLLGELRQTSDLRLNPEVISRRLAQQFFQTERQLFCNAANQLLQHRQWVKRLGFLDDTFFDELDKFADDIDVMRDMNEHAIEYFEGKGKRPHDWVYQGEGATSDASSTVETKIGGRLDWVELGSAAQRLLVKISQMGPVLSES